VNGEQMGMTNKQFQGFVRLLLKAVKSALKADNDKTKEELKELETILQEMLEDGN
jgi:ribosomal protein S20